MLAGSELSLLRLMTYRGLWLLETGTVLIAIEDRAELRIACRGDQQARVSAAQVQESALGALYRAGRSLAVSRPRGEEAAWLHELGLEAQSALVEPFTLETQGGGLVIALRRNADYSASERDEFSAFAASVGRELDEVRSVEIKRLRYGMEARERERTRWAREIHDESIQGMGALRMKLAHARDLDDPAALREAVEVALDGLGNEIDGLRHLITELRPAALDDLGLEAALQALARRAQAVDGLGVTIEMQLGGEGRRLDAELESTIYRIVQEALTNVSRHAQASSAVVNVSEHDGVLDASVTDDGRGLPGAERLAPRGDGLEGGFGMSGMRERAELVGGDLRFGPAAGGGTTVSLLVPLASRPVPETEDVGASAL